MITVDTMPRPISFAPASETEEIVQNVRMILTTLKGSCPLARDFGIASDVIDAPLNVATSLYRQAVVEAISNYEPRAEVVDVDFAGSEPIDGRLNPRVTIRIKEAA